MNITAVLTHELQLPPISPPAPTRAMSEQAGAVERVEQLVARAAYAEAIEAAGDVFVPATSMPDLSLRLLFAESRARMYLGELDFAVAVLERARSLAEGPSFTDVDRAEALFRLGCCRLKLGKIANAVSLFTTALPLAGGSDRLRASVLEWRSRAHQVQRDWESARSDAEQSHELAQQVGDDHSAAHALFQCSLVAERTGDTLLARFYAEEAKEAYDRVGDRQSAARMLNNLGGLAFLLGDAVAAVAFLKDAYALSLEAGNDADAAQAVSSLAQVHLRCGAPQLAEEQARHALAFLAERDDYLDERGNVQLVLGRALLAQDRADEALSSFAAAERTFEQLGSQSHVAAAWMAQGDHALAAGDSDTAAELFRRAAQALQDFNF
jgi:tetratricopeptide (TPR) repeat protein